MIVTHKALSRRTVLRGLGATVALPLLDAMVPALSATARAVTAPAPRLAFLLRAERHPAAQLPPGGKRRVELRTDPGAGARSRRSAIR